MATTRPTDGNPARLIDARAAGELLGVPPSWILAEARCNRLPHVRLGRYVRFRRETLLAWVRERERGPIGDGTARIRGASPSARRAR